MQTYLLLPTTVELATDRVHAVALICVVGIMAAFARLLGRHHSLRFLPLAAATQRVALPGLTAASVVALTSIWPQTALSTMHAVAGFAVLAAAIVWVAGSSRHQQHHRLRARNIAFVGDTTTARALDAELLAAGTGARLVSTEVTSAADLISAPVPPDLIVYADTQPDLVERITPYCLDRGVMLQPLSESVEDHLGLVPLGHLDEVWFSHLLVPSHRPLVSAPKRALDLLVVALVAPFALLVVLASAPFIARDGGPVFYHQERVGQGGRLFRIYKLRTMTFDPASAEQWSSATDPRVTRIGKLLRATHLDEMPQLLNVARGDMSVVGPRPEQPGLAQSLAEKVPFYARRHLARPGVTGWAQILGGYAGSEDGSRCKCAYDLYYLKHRGAVLDMLIIFETLRNMFADDQWPGVRPSMQHLMGALERPRLPSAPGARKRA